MAAVLAVIPARLASTRLPRKMLLADTGKPLVQHVWEAVRRCPQIGRIAVATDSEEIAQVVGAFGGEAVMTSPTCASGTDRVAQAVRQLPGADLVVNVQGDEPEMAEAPLTALVAGMLERPEAQMGTVATPWPADIAVGEPSCVKVVCNQGGNALYFSRSPIPYSRQGATPVPRYLKHLGLYAYRPAFLQTFTQLSPTPLERAESLEQLRALEHGYSIAVFESHYEGHEINTPADYAAFVARWRQRSGN